MWEQSRPGGREGCQSLGDLRKSRRGRGSVRDLGERRYPDGEDV